MENRITFSVSSEDDLNNIAQYIYLSTKNLDFSINYLNKMREFIKERLEKYPLSGFYPNNRSLRGLGYRYLNFDSYLIFYLIKEDEIRVMAIINAKQDYYKYNNF